MGIRTSGLAAALAAVFSAGAVAADPISTASMREIQQQVEAMYPLAKATADGTDLVTPGAVIVLGKDELLMNSVTLPFPSSNIYKDGAIKPNGLLGALGAFHSHLVTSGGDNPSPTREFVTGEKMWLTQIDTTRDGVVLHLMSDPYSNQRYHSTLRVPFPKDTTPSADVVLNEIGQVIHTDGGSAADAPSAAQSQAVTASTPPGPAQTKTIAIGQTKQQVGSLFGSPTKVVQLGTKEIDYYPDMKVTFVQNKVTDVN